MIKFYDDEDIACDFDLPSSSHFSEIMTIESTKHDEYSGPVNLLTYGTTTTKITRQEHNI
jgi:hypothetical protein